MNTFPPLQLPSALEGSGHSGWQIAAAYALSTALCLLAALRAHRVPGTTRGSPALWIGVATLMGFLCANHLADIARPLSSQFHALIAATHVPSRLQGPTRWLLPALLATAAGTIAFLAWFCFDFLRNHLVLITGLTFLLTLAIAGNTIPQFDSFSAHTTAKLPLGDILELIGTILICFAAYLEYQNPAKPPPKRWQPAT